MNKSLILLLVAAFLLTACGGGAEETVAPTSTTAVQSTEPPTAIPPIEPPTEPPTAEPTTAEAPPEEDLPPGTRLSTVDSLAANGENSLVLLANPGDILIAGVEPASGQDVALGLFLLTGSGGGELVTQMNSGPGFETLAYTFEVAGAYRLAIREINGVAGEYAMRIASTPGVALTIAPQHTVEGKLEGPGGLSYLHNGYVGRELRLTVTPAVDVLDLQVTIIALSDMSQVLLYADERGAGEAETVVFLPPADDEYLITVQDNGQGTGAFSLAMSEE